MEPETQHAVDIAVLKEQVNGLREQQKAHADATSKRFDALDESVGELIAAFNKGKGAYAVLFVLSGILGAAILKGIGLLVSVIK